MEQARMRARAGAAAVAMVVLATSWAVPAGAAEDREAAPGAAAAQARTTDLPPDRDGLVDGLEARTFPVDMGAPGNRAVAVVDDEGARHESRRHTVIDLPRQPEMLIVDDATVGMELALRTRTDGTWSDWSELHVTDGDAPDGLPGGEGSAAAPGSAGSVGPVWLGHGVDQVQMVVLEGTDTSLTVETLEVVEAESLAESTGEPQGVRSSVSVTGPTIRSRSQWATADMGWASYNSGCGSAPDTNGRVKAMVVHHTAGGNAYYSTSDAINIMRGIWRYHVQTKGWCDVAYNFFVDRFGGTWEGRLGGITRAVVGGHTFGFNGQTSGLAQLGNFETGYAPEAMTVATERLVGWKLGKHRVNPLGNTILTNQASTQGSSRYAPGQSVKVSTVIAHRNLSYTTCPGTYTYRNMDRIRQNAYPVYLEYRPAPTSDTVGIVRDGRWELRNSNSAGYPDVVFDGVGKGAAMFISGDFDGDGHDDPGYVVGNTFYLHFSATPGSASVVLAYGKPGDLPVIGDWDGDGIDSVGVRRNNVFYLRNDNTSGVADITMGYGKHTDTPIVGDWDGDGHDTFGVRRNNAFYLRNSNTTGIAHLSFGYGKATDTPVAGDWNADGIVTLGVRRGSLFYLRDSNTSGPATNTFLYGLIGDRPIVGDWDAR